MPNRYVRDELIGIALDQAVLPNLKIHDMPDGVVQPDAYSIQWLQDILDFWYHMVPFSATVDYVTLNAVANQDYILLPTDFILDVRNGYVVETVPGDTTSLRRRERVSLQKFINRQLYHQKTTSATYPSFYCIVGDDATTQQQKLKITPTPSMATQGKLWYYKLPTKLNSNDKPKFPNDYVCIEYVRIRAKEWANIFEPGTAQKFCDKIVAGMKAAGLMNEPEDDEIPMDTLYYHKSRGEFATYAWMGQV